MFCFVLLRPWALFRTSNTTNWPLSLEFVPKSWPPKHAPDFAIDACRWFEQQDTACSKFWASGILSFKSPKNTRCFVVALCCIGCATQNSRRKNKLLTQCIVTTALCHKIVQAKHNHILDTGCKHARLIWTQFECVALRLKHWEGFHTGWHAVVFKLTSKTPPLGSILTPTSKWWPRVTNVKTGRLKFCAQRLSCKWYLRQHETEHHARWWRVTHQVNTYLCWRSKQGKDGELRTLTQRKQ